MIQIFIFVLAEVNWIEFLKGTFEHFSKSYLNQKVILMLCNVSVQIVDNKKQKLLPDMESDYNGFKMQMSTVMKHFCSRF
jgi:hypothetical protein